MAKSMDIENSFRTHRPQLVGFCVRMLGDRPLAEDIVQDVFLKACAQANEEPSAAWLYQCARNRCIDHHRRRGKWSRLKALLGRDHRQEGFESELLDKEVGWKILCSLPEKMRAILVLRAYVGLGYSELAEVFDMTTSSVGVLLSRARQKACTLMEKEMQQ